MFFAEGVHLSMLANHESNKKNIPQRKEGGFKYCKELLLLFMSGVVQIF